MKPVTVSRFEISNGKTPLKITLKNNSDVFKILDLSRHLKSNQTFNEVRITSEKTPKNVNIFKTYIQNLTSDD